MTTPKYYYDCKWHDEPQIPGCWYIDTDGKTVLEWTCIDSKGTILLSDGRELTEDQYLGSIENPGRIFASHPDQNPYIEKNSEGVYSWIRIPGRSFKAMPDHSEHRLSQAIGE